MPKVGLAMIARNGADHIAETVGQFDQHVDEVAIVLGGISEDSTPDLAEQLATLTVETCQKYDDLGRLEDFADARGLTFKLLEKSGCEFAVVVDVEETWEGVESLVEVIELMEQDGHAIAILPHFTKNGMRFEQPRVYRLRTGRWVGRVHEYYELSDPKSTVCRIGSIHVHSDQLTGPERRAQNIELGRLTLNDSPTPRVMLNLASDLMANAEDDSYAEAVQLLNGYLVEYHESSDYRNQEELFHAHYLRAVAFVNLERYADGLQSAMMALTVRPFAAAWSISARCCAMMSLSGADRQAMLEMTIFCADRAMSMGLPRSMLWSKPEEVIGEACYYKALALTVLSRQTEALGPLDFGLALFPENELMLNARQSLCQQIGVLEE